MLKLARRIFVFLLFGAIVNAAVAWGCAVAGRNVMRTRIVYRNPRSGEAPVFTGEASFGFEMVRGIDDWWTLYATGDNNRGWPSVYPSHAWWPERGVDYHLIVQAAAGWPMLSLRETWYEDLEPVIDPDDYGSAAATAINAHVTSRNGSTQFGIPALLSLRPIAPGFVTNTLLYAGATVIVLLGRSTLRQSVRRHRSLCAHCGYPRGASPVCTECGEILPEATPARS